MGLTKVLDLREANDRELKASWDFINAECNIIDSERVTCFNYELYATLKDILARSPFAVRVTTLELDAAFKITKKHLGRVHIDIFDKKGVTNGYNQAT